MVDMKKYFISQRIYSKDLKITEHPDGEWVKASDIPKIKADAVLEVRQDIIDNVVIPKAPPVGEDYYKAAIRHAVSNLEAYADKLERGE